MKDRIKENAPNIDANLQSDSLIDLPVVNDQADQTKGGQTDISGYNTWRTNFGRTS
ncbi:MAG TPA: hypothetical protein VLD57_10775 [Blastocatellia bacterium]|nr:hypothetical protein [Blastocatellia bacterium]